jgi:CRISPR-associated protein Csd1
MTILQALDRYYGRLPDVAPPGWSMEKFGWCVVIDGDGRVLDVENLHGVSLKGKQQIVLRKVPASFSRTGKSPRAFFLWDAAAYVFGVPSPKEHRASDKHAAFVALHTERLAGHEDDGLVALRRFLERWQPEHFASLPHGTPEMLDTNIMFRLEGDAGYLHERPAARALVDRSASSGNGGQMCLVSGAHGPVARLHPTIKGVNGAQSSGAALVSFNLEAFTSYGQEQGGNAPTSEAVAFRYGTALNQMLQRDGRNRLRRPIGDATVLFWADASEAAATDAADNWMSAVLDEVTDEQEAFRLRGQLDAIAAGCPASDIVPGVRDGTRFHVLGLAPNAARLAVRFWLTDSFDHFARAVAAHAQDMRIEPLPQRWGAAPSVTRLLAETTALQGELKNVPPQLAGEMMRAVLTGGPYPQSLLAAALMRLRAGDDAGRGWHAAVIRGVMMRSQILSEAGEPPMALDRDHEDPGYQLGRLFAVYELAQRAALGRVNASIRDRYFGAASATPASVFPLIVRGGQNHLSKVRKEKPGWAHLIERELEEIHSHLEAELPRTLNLQRQGSFAIGYYHQRAAKLTSDKGEVIDPTVQPETDEDDA